MTNKDVTKALAGSLKKPAEKFADSEIIVIGNNHCWGRGKTLDEARKNASRPARWMAFIVAAEGTSVSEMDGALSWQRGNAPRLIAHSAGWKPSALANPGLLLRSFHNGEEEE